MIGLLCFILTVLASPFKSKLRLEAENAVLRHQLNVLRRRLRGRARLTNNDRWFFIRLYRWFPSILQVLTIVQPETLVRWHRAGFRCYWRWKSRPLGGRPRIDTELRVLIRRMSMENPLWGAPRIHGEHCQLMPPFLHMHQDFAYAVGNTHGRLHRFRMPKERTGLPAMSAIRSLPGVNRTSPERLDSVAFDPGRVETFFVPQKLQATGRDGPRRDRLSLFLLY